MGLVVITTPVKNAGILHKFSLLAGISTISLLRKKKGKQYCALGSP